MVTLQKSDIVSVAQCGFFVVFKKQIIYLLRYPRWADSLVNGEVP